MTKFLFILLLITNLFSYAQDEVIIPINFSEYEKLFVPGMTQKKSDEISLKQVNEIREKSIGKKLPDITVRDSNNNSILLKELINQKTLITIANAHCSFGLESLTNDLPKALEKLKSLEKQVHIIVLFEWTPEDEIDSTRFYRNYSEIAELYSNVYIINEVDSRKINIYSSPIRYYFNENGLLMERKSGLSNVERLFDEIVTVFDSF